MSTSTQPVLVTGATGRVGRLVVDELLREGVPVRALTRRPGAAALPPAVEVFAGDLSVPESLDAALKGAGAVFLLWTAPPATVPGVIDRIASDARRVVVLSSPHQTAHPFFQQSPNNPMAVLHASIERHLAQSGVATTVIRPGMFASNALLWWATSIRNGDAVRWPYGAAETAPIDERDIAAVAARSLTDDQVSGGDYVLTGPDSLSQAEQVGIIGEAIGCPVHFVELSPEDFRRETAGIWPGPVVDMLLAAWSAAIGQPALVTSSVFEVTGSPARSFRQWAADHAGAFSVSPPL
jgi:uncharacterized protein YbjT (DUF2867 family)